MNIEKFTFTLRDFKFMFNFYVVNAEYSAFGIN